MLAAGCASDTVAAAMASSRLRVFSSRSTTAGGTPSFHAFVMMSPSSPLVPSESATMAHAKSDDTSNSRAASTASRNDSRASMRCEMSSNVSSGMDSPVHADSLTAASRLRVVFIGALLLRPHAPRVMRPHGKKSMALETNPSAMDGIRTSTCKEVLRGRTGHGGPEMNPLANLRVAGSGPRIQKAKSPGGRVDPACRLMRPAYRGPGPAVCGRAPAPWATGPT